MAESARDASSSDDAYAALDALAFSSDAEEQAASDRTAEKEESVLKKCSGCQASKPLTEYFKDVSRSDGLQPQCKVCRSEAKRHYAKRNRTGVEAEDEKAKEGGRR